MSYIVIGNRGFVAAFRSCFLIGINFLTNFDLFLRFLLVEDMIYTP